MDVRPIQGLFGPTWVKRSHTFLHWQQRACRGQELGCLIAGSAPGDIEMRFVIHLEPPSLAIDRVGNFTFVESVRAFVCDQSESPRHAGIAEELPGFGRLAAIHLNDSKVPLNSHVDRHEHIGKGKIGIEAFRFIMNQPKFAKIPKILETPKGKEMAEDVVGSGFNGPVGSSTCDDKVRGALGAVVPICFGAPGALGLALGSNASAAS